MNQRRIATFLLIAGVLLTSVSIGLLVHNVLPSFTNATTTSSYETPVDMTLPLEQGDYVLWVQDSGSGAVSVFGDDFTITDTNGQALPFRAVTRSEVLSRRDGSFVGELEFTVPQAGSYTVAVHSDVATRVVISQDFFRRVIANLWWVGGAGVGLLGFVVGAVLLIVNTRNARRRREHDAFIAAYGFPPGYGPPPMASYGPTGYGPPPAYPGAPQHPGPYQPSYPTPPAYPQSYPPSYPQSPHAGPTDPTLPGGQAGQPGQPGQASDYASPMSPALPYPGWYPDPEDRTRYRWWSGTTWESSYANESDIS